MGADAICRLCAAGIHAAGHVDTPLVETGRERLDHQQAVLCLQGKAGVLETQVLDLELADLECPVEIEVLDRVHFDRSFFLSTATSGGAALLFRRRQVAINVHLVHHQVETNRRAAVIRNRDAAVQAAVIQLDADWPQVRPVGGGLEPGFKTGLLQYACVCRLRLFLAHGLHDGAEIDIRGLDLPGE